MGLSKRRSKKIDKKVQTIVSKIGEKKRRENYVPLPEVCEKAFTENRSFYKFETEDGLELSLDKYRHSKTYPSRWSPNPVKTKIQTQVSYEKEKVFASELERVIVDIPTTYRHEEYETLSYISGEWEEKLENLYQKNRDPTILERIIQKIMR